MQRSNRDFQDVLDEAARLHGHLCEGLVLGVRMAVAGLDELGIKDPKSREGMDLVIFVEIDRCPVDGIIAVTGRTPGKRSIKMMDYGKIAATFVDARCGRAVRVSARGDYVERLAAVTKIRMHGLDDRQVKLAALKTMARNDLFNIQSVSVRIPPRDLPGKTLDQVICGMCGEVVKDSRQVLLDGKAVCRPCSLGKDYYDAEYGILPGPGYERLIWK